MIRHLVLTYGRPKTWAILIVGPIVLLFALLFALIGVATTLSTSEVDEAEPPLRPGEALAIGGHTIQVCVVCKGTGAPLTGGMYSVATLDGRAPSVTEDTLAGNLAQVVVGPDWVGRITVIYSGSTYSNQRVTTDLIGEAYGWHDRVLEAECPVDTALLPGDKDHA